MDDDEYYIPEAAAAQDEVRSRRHVGSSSRSRPRSSSRSRPRSRSSRSRSRTRSRSRSRSSSRSRSRSRYRRDQRSRSRSVSPERRRKVRSRRAHRLCVFVCNIPYGSDDVDLYRHFVDYGFRPRTIRLYYDRGQRFSKGYAHVEFDDESEVMSVISKVNQTMLFPRRRHEYPDDRGFFPRSICVKLPKGMEEDDRRRREPEFESWRPREGFPRSSAADEGAARSPSPVDSRRSFPFPPLQVAQAPPPPIESYMPRLPADPSRPRRGEAQLPAWMTSASSAEVPGSKKEDELIEALHNLISASGPGTCR